VRTADRGFIYPGSFKILKYKAAWKTKFSDEEHHKPFLLRPREARIVSGGSCAKSRIPTIYASHMDMSWDFFHVQDNHFFIFELISSPAGAPKTQTMCDSSESLRDARS
jgi:hypothetical protein